MQNIVVNKIVLSVALLFTILLFNSSCSSSSPDQLAPVQLAKWVEDPSNGLRMQKEISDLEFTLQYKPLDYVVVLEEKQKVLASTKVKQRKEALGDELHYFNLRIKSMEQNSPLNVGATSDAAYQERLAYCTFGMQKDLKMIEGADTLDCVLYQYVRNYELAPYIDFVLGFEKKNKAEAKETDKTIILHDQTFGVGIIKFLLKGNSLKNIPQLKTI